MAGSDRTDGPGFQKRQPRHPLEAGLERGKVQGPSPGARMMREVVHAGVTVTHDEQKHRQAVQVWHIAPVEFTGQSREQ